MSYKLGIEIFMSCSDFCSKKILVIEYLFYQESNENWGIEFICEQEATIFPCPVMAPSLEDYFHQEPDKSPTSY